ncbi:hypothetical protein HPB50_021460 [Hyalomma asiaticum]|uniref:Uncharacterized protein n=1 Tax=Hyalomma asiaticum TaxID=266040 RepID=A0ACB7RX03_HYAAI|nr:hypothetical protein HPB50_028197 [Hyalomma asiaticum]KAH6926750.1 hypothetical protein HPB50_021460 [Hyalomma asiaticum]
MFDHIDNNFGHLLDDLSKHEWLSLSHLDELSQAFCVRVASMRNWRPWFKAGTMLSTGIPHILFGHFS